MRYKISVPSGGPGSHFITPHGHIEIDAHGHATVGDAARAHLEASYGATFEPLAVAPASEAVREPSAPDPTAAASIAANAEAAAIAADEAQRIPAPRTKRKRD